MIAIRTLVPDDAVQVAALTGQLGYAVDCAATRERLERLGRSSEQLLLAACEGTRVVGWLQAARHETIEAGPRVEIHGLVVDATCRRTGTGRALLAAAEAWARSLEIHTLVVRSNVTRAESHRFYPALGFTLNKTQAVYAKPLH